MLETIDARSGAPAGAARRIAGEGMVLLKNNGILPLQNPQHIAVIGHAAQAAHFQGGGSSHINATHVDVPFVELQKLADELGIETAVCHYPPGTSKWNKIEHRLFCHITQTWRGRPLTDRLAVVELIAATTTTTGLRVESALDTRSYQKGIKVSDAEMAALNIKPATFQGDWNYTFVPRRPDG